jgi:peptide/nickel transport system permease protein
MPDISLAAPAAVEKHGRSISARILSDAMRNTGFRVGFVLLIIILAASIIVPEVSHLSATKISVKEKFLPPLFFGDNWSFTHPLGTDQLGRDMLLRCLIGLRYSLFIGVTTVVLMFLVGCTLGLLAGYKGGWWDTIIMRITDAQLSLPMIILAISILGVSTPTVTTIILVLALSGWPLYARVARGLAITERGKEYIRGLRVLGAGDLRIMLLFVAPNILPGIAFVAVLDVARMMIFEAILGFLGLGIQPPTPSFGTIISDSRKYLINAWWIATMPGLFLTLVLVSINLMGSALEKARNRIYGGAS